MQTVTVSSRSPRGQLNFMKYTSCVYLKASVHTNAHGQLTTGSRLAQG